MSREFDDGTVCFDPDTGETLLLSPLSSFLLGLWKPDPHRAMTRDELLARVLAADDSATDAAEAADLVERALGELQRAGLVTCGADA